MSEEPAYRRRRLGRGLSALLGEDPEEQTAAPMEAMTEDPSAPPRQIAVSSLQPNPYQPRREFNPEAMEELTDSIRRNGVLQPILVRPNPHVPGAYQIIAGERRWRAAQEAQLHEVPIVIRDLTDRDALEIALVENLQRQDLTPLEEGEGYRKLMDEFSHTQEDLATVVGKSRSHIANTLRLLQLPDEVKEMLTKKLITAGHARALLTSGDPVSMAEQVVIRGLNVRQTEKLVQEAANDSGDEPSGKRRKSKGDGPTKDADTLALERDVSNALGLTVSIDFKGRGGTMTIAYESLAQLDDIVNRLTRT
ncbi:MAG: ParB/RepB/Spo0J family partition protein, partial [Rhodospirillaceae bacterium]